MKGWARLPLLITTQQMAIGGDVFLSLTNTRATDGRFYFGGDHGLTTFSSITANKTYHRLLLFLTYLFLISLVFEMQENSPLTESLQETKSMSLLLQSK
jgi:hypothetical protein